MITREYICRLPDLEKLKIVRSYEKLERDGFLGEEGVRIHAKKLMEELGTDNNVVLWMRELAFESYRYFANKYLASKHE